MSTTITVPATRVVSPRGAVWAARAASSAWLALAGWLAQRRRASIALDAAEEAALVRAMARRMQATDPNFAADLYAAADRHEAAATGAA